MGSTQKVTADLSAIVAGVRDGRGTVGKFLTDDAFYTSVKKIAGQAEETVANLRQASVDAKAAVADLRGDKGPFNGISKELQETLSSARDAMADLAENTEALKRNFLFRGFFNKRGYFDLQDVTVQQYREGALETGERRVLRIWVGTPVLFEQTDAGEERISNAGKERLDSAMSQFLKYPAPAPSSSRATRVGR